MSKETISPKRKRGRPKKTPVEENEQVLNEKAKNLQMSEKSETASTPLTMQQVQLSLSGLFREALSQSFEFSDRDSLYNPFIQNNRLKLLTSYPAIYAPDQIAQFLQQPQYHEIELRGASAALSASQYLYYQIIREAADIPLFKTTIIPPLLTKEKYESKEFEEEEEFVCDWVRAFDPINTLKRVALETKRDGKSTYLLRQSFETKNGKTRTCYVTWQKLPLQWIKLTGIGEHGYTASFNLMMFMQPGFSPSQYPDFIQDIWNDMIKGKIVYIKDDKYTVDVNKLRAYKIKPNKYFAEETQGVIEIEKKSYMYWIPLPQDICFTFASDTSNAWAVPDTIGLFPALQELTDYSTLAGLIASTPLTAVLTGEMEPVSNAQPGQDQFILAPHTATSFMNTWNGMASSNTQAFFAPLKNLKLQSLPNVPNSSDIKTKAVQNFISTAGEGGLITATDKPSVAMIKGAQARAASQYAFVTAQMETILNDNLHKHTPIKYEWKLQLWGDIYSFPDAVRSLKEQVQAGAVFLLPRLASAYDLTMRDIRGLGNYMEAFEVYDRFKPLQWAQTQLNSKSNISSSTESNSVGRPAMDDLDVINDNTAASKDAGDDTGEMRDFARNNVCLICHNHLVEDGEFVCEDCKENYDLAYFEESLNV